MMKSFLMLTMLATVSFALIFGNPHDYTVENFSDETYREQCANCHTFESEDSEDSFTINSTDTSFSDSSLICLACHDGVTASDLPTVHKEFETDYEASNSLNSNRSHPVMIAYTEGVAGLRSKETPTDNWSNANNINDLLRDGKIECGSCHNPHDKKEGMYLKHSNENSELCFTCHDK